MVATAGIEPLLEHLKGSRGFDFTGYKRPSLERRVRRRMEALGIDSYEAYLDHLEVHPDEFANLFDSILINVTRFFRDPEAWAYLQDDALPELLARIPDDQPVRVWSAGCASGEETYSLAMSLAQIMGERAYCERVKIYATDVDDGALGRARQATYDAKAVEGVPQPLLERFFELADQRYVFRKDLRRTVIFGRNDLVQDAPISRIDLLACRNTLMYFNAETQGRILRRFNFALNDRGDLFLGKSEMLLTHGDLFRPLNLKQRVFQKVGRAAGRDRLLSAAAAGALGGGDEPHGLLRDRFLDAGPVAMVGVDVDGTVVLVNRQARDLFHVTPADVGRPLKDLELSYRPAELRAALERVFADRRAIVLGGVTAAMAGGELRDLEVQISPVTTGDDLRGASVAFHDVTVVRRAQEELETSKHELEHAYEELQSTVEELETTNEELQSTNEELETTNEELQSTNEELETMNEELQSTNEELETINDELQTRTVELDDVNDFLQTILTSLGVGVVVVNRDQVVRVWNAHAADLWGLQAAEVEGRHLLGLDMGLPLEGLGPALAAVLRGREPRTETVLAARNRRGRDISCRVTCLPLGYRPDDVSGAIVLMEELDVDVLADGDGEAAHAVDPSRARARPGAA